MRKHAAATTTGRSRSRVTSFAVTIHTQYDATVTATYTVQGNRIYMLRTLSIHREKRKSVVHLEVCWW